ncbi:MAG: UTP--glucose-1-phosphate uridylyltransferase [Acidobacteria bacterium]|nr:MAG: UTP--glucose-1-phosphate uridylyltransferase [Acidobacteriota bacterium]
MTPADSGSPARTPIRKAVIPAAGLGTRFLPATKSQPKEMLPLVDKPAIQYVVEEAIGAGLDDILIITGRGKRTLEDHFDRSFELEHYLETSGKTDLLKEVQSVSEMGDIHYIRQRDPLGLGHAISVADRHVGREPFAVLLGDDICADGEDLLREMIRVYEASTASVVAVMEIPPEDSTSYGIIEPGESEGNLVEIKSIVEKPEPEDAPSNLAVIGRYLFTPAIFDALAETKPGRGGEIQLTDGIQLLLADEPVYALVFTGIRHDLGRKDDWLRATVQVALDREDLGPEFGGFLARIVKERGLS